MIGGNGPKRTLPLAARYADEWNAVYATPDRFAELSSLLDDYATAEGRETGAIKRTLMHRVIVGRNEAEIARKTEGLDFEVAIERGVVIGEPGLVLEKLKAFESVGVTRLMAQWLDMDDFEGLELLATEVLPHLA